MKLYELFTMFGASGLPLVVDNEFKSTWEAYDTSIDNTWFARVLHVLGFLYLMHQAKATKMLSLKTNPKTLYQKLRQDEFAALAKNLTTQLNRLRLLDVLAAYKTKFTLISPIRGDVARFRFDLCLSSKRKEPLDSALTKLSGLLYVGDLPKQLQEVWRKVPIKSNAAPKSALPKWSVVLGTDSNLGFLPITANKDYSVFCRRAADDFLMVRIVVPIATPKIPWLSARNHEILLTKLAGKELLKLKG